MLPDEIPTGDSDKGLVCAYRLDGHGGGIPLGPQDLEKNHDGLIWVHLDFSHPRGRDWILNRSELDPLVVEALLSEESRPRTLEYDGGILTVLRGVNTNQGEDVEDMVSIRIWIEKNRIISTRRRRLKSVRDLSLALEEGKGPTSPGSFLVALTDRLGDRIGNTVEAIDDA